MSELRQNHVRFTKYVGVGRDKVSLYKGKECIEKNIPEEMAIEKLIALIKAHGDWIDPS